MDQRVIDKASIYVPQEKLKGRLLERLVSIGAKQDRSLNYMMIIAIEEFLEREEAKE